MDFIYINDTHFREQSGEVHHTVGFLNAIDRDVIYLTAKKNKLILEKKINNGNVKLKYVSDFKILRVIKNIIFILKNKINIIYMRKSFYSSIYLLFLRGNIFIEINGIATRESHGITAILNRISDYITYKSKRVATFICVADGIAAYISENYSLNNCEVVENGVGENFVKNINFKDKDKNRFVFVGGLSTWQDFDYLINTINNNKKYIIDNNIIIDIYGDGPKKEYIKERIEKHKLTKIVYTHGAVDNEEIPNLIENAGVGLLLDNRFYNSAPLFSPLKYFEYRALGINTIFLSEKENIEFKKDIENVSIKNFIKWHVIFKQKSGNTILTRSWKDVVLDTERIIHDKILYK